MRISGRVPLEGSTTASSVSRSSAKEGSPHSVASVRPLTTWAAVGPPSARSVACRRRSTPSAAWAGVTPRAPAAVSIAAVAGVHPTCQRVVSPSEPAAPVTACSFA